MKHHPRRPRCAAPPRRGSISAALALSGLVGLTPIASAAAQDAWAPGAPTLELAQESVGDLPPSVTAETAEGGGWRLTFTLRSSVRADSVVVAGSFNGWSQTATPMERGADGRWRAVVTAPGGAHGYKFVVDGDRWIPDPENDDHEPDNFGGVNSVVRLGALGRPGALTGRVGDGEVSTAVLEHDPSRSIYLQRLAGERALVRYRTLARDVEAVVLVLESGLQAVMAPVASPDPFAFWETNIALPDAPVRYGFLVVDGDTRGADPRVLRLDPDALAHFTTPDWAKHATWYQVFPERFRNGDPENDPDRVRPWTSDWDIPSKWEGADGQTFWEYYVFQRMYGGDLAGVAASLDHLQSLGVTAIYFNPVFAADGSHKYNATDFRHIDPGFGAGEDLGAITAQEDLLDPDTWTWSPSDRQFLELLASCKKRGIRVVIDGVFNHVGVRHPAFQDVVANGEASRFADWFDVLSWEPFRYAGWAGFGELPVFAKDADGLRSDAVERHVFEITRRWMDPNGDGDPSDGIDGWRLDVPMEIAMPFWERWRRVVKSINPDATIIGEVWDRADAWLDGKRFDAVMNYPFADAVIRWIGHEDGKITASELDRRLGLLRLAYPAEATYALMNLVDSHDTDRLVSMLANPDRAYDAGNRVQDGAPYDASRPGERSYRRARLVALLQATYVGAPMIYYGDEMGMWGPDDPVNRKPMLWKDLQPYANEDDAVDAAHLAHYRAVFRLRQAHASLRVGSFTTLLADDEQDLWVFQRAHGGETSLVALNASERPARFELPELAGWKLVHGARTPDGGIPPISGCVWVTAAR